MSQWPNSFNVLLTPDLSWVCSFFFTCYLLICLFVCFWPWSEEGPARPPTSTVALKQTNHRHPQLISINDITAAIEGGKAMLISLLPQGLLVWSFLFFVISELPSYTINYTIPYHILPFNNIQSQSSIFNISLSMTPPPNYPFNNKQYQTIPYHTRTFNT